jgi:hypothetical protein
LTIKQPRWIVAWGLAHRIAFESEFQVLCQFNMMFGDAFDVAIDDRKVFHNDPN